jgi:D-arabinose 1-dehydrogenase-like Zn-dependent alcohol dehydrogenase
MGEYHHSGHAVWDIKYHLIWITKYRYKVLVGEVGERAHDQLCESPQWAGLSIHDGGYAGVSPRPSRAILGQIVDAPDHRGSAADGCRAAAVSGDQESVALLEPDHYALVIGLCGLGQYGLKLLKLLAGCPIIVVDVHEPKLRLARELGATHAFNGRDDDVAAKIRDITGGHGVNASFDFVGSDATLAIVPPTPSTGRRHTQCCFIVSRAA